MRCKSCDYLLWNLKARQCPECGAAFRPSEYEFTANSVRFCCPHCDQSYFGTDDHGHLVPREFECVSCRQRVRLDDMVLRPGEGVEEAQTKPDRMPWLERERRGVLRAWFATIGAAMTRPQSLMRAIPDSTSAGRAWCFMFFTNMVFITVGQLIPTAVVLVAFWVTANSATGGPPMGPMMLVQTIPQSAATIVAIAILPLLWVWLTHGLLAVTGGAGANVRQTAHAIYYSTGANAPSAIPCDCIALVGRIWWLVSATLMVKEVHQCHGGRAALAVVGSGLFLAIVFTFSIFAVMFFTMGGLGGFGGWPTGPTETQTIVRHVIRYANAHNGQGPPHASFLAANTGFGTSNFVTWSSATTESAVPVAETTLDQLELLPPNRQRMAAQAAADALPENVVAHRLGDFVFTYHGAQLNRMDPQLWTVVMLPDPTVNGPPAAGDPVHIGANDQTVSEITFGELAEALKQQNAYRATLGLPPLPDLITVTHENPATAPPKKE